MSKKFYIVVPFSVVGQTEGKKGIIGAVRSMLSPAKFVRSLTDEEVLAYQMQLNQRVDLVLSGIGRLGINTRVLGKEELINLYKSLYNAA